MEDIINKINKAIDLVCGMEVETTSAQTASHKGETYYFCSSSCQKHFIDNPEDYVGQDK